MKHNSKPRIPSYAQYEVKDGNGNLVTVAGNFEQVIIRVASFAAYIPNDQAPAVALAILAAAGFVPHGNRPDSDQIQEAVDNAAGELLNAINWAAKETAAKELTKRRDELAQEFIPHIPGITYGTLATAGVKHAIDMIIQLQNEAAK